MESPRGKDKKKNKKHKKDKKQKRKKYRHSSSSSSSEDEVWVEKKVDKKEGQDKIISTQSERDEWMSIPSLFTGISRKELKGKPKEKEVKKLDLPGQSDRELNPYWKNGGTGLPSVSAEPCTSSNYFQSRSNHFQSIKERKCDFHMYNQSKFLRPSEEQTDGYSKILKDEQTRKGDEASERNLSSNSRWKKRGCDNSDVRRNNNSVEASEKVDHRNPPLDSGEGNNCEKEISKTMTIDELNYLAAKALKAEITGNLELAASLQRELEIERNKREVVVLSRTDNKGFTRPVRNPEHEFSKQKHKAKVETHSDGKRVRYFADDDKYSLKNIFEQEKLGLSADHDEEFSRLAKKNIGPDGSTRDMDDVFEEAARKDAGTEKRERMKAIREHQIKEKAMDSCRWCLDNKNTQENIVTIGREVYLCVPPYQSLTEGHCLIIPNQHIPCATLLDEDVWKELMDMKRALVKFYEDRDEDVVFFESVSNFKYHPHMVINSVPIAKEVGDIAPIYFKKAIQECEMEWSNNKKLVELAGKGVRRAIPKGLPYFSVDFGLQDGFAHIIEDHKLFPNNFAQEIIGGMLDLDHSLWRKPRRENPELLREKASKFSESFKKYNPTKQE